jgi:hypothetical protein
MRITAHQAQKENGIKITTRPNTRPSQRSTLIATTSVAIVALTVAVSRAEAQVIPPPVPTNLEVEYGNTPFLVGHAIGTQNYVCLLKAGGFVWTFFGPQATLFGDDGQQLITHFFSARTRTRMARCARHGSSRRTPPRRGRWVIANSTDPAYVVPGAIPWLLLRVIGAEDGPTGGAILSATTLVQRVNTSRGIAPAAHGCAQAVDIGRKALVPYTADYIFYRN